MAWTEPKTNWGATDPVTHTQLNAIGANLVFLNRIVYSGRWRGSLGGWDYAYPQKCLVKVPDGQKLVLSHWRFYLDDSDMLLLLYWYVVGVGYLGTYEQSSSYYADEDKAVTAYSNSTGSDKYAYCDVALKNNAAAGVGDIETGWWLQFHLEDV